MVRKRSYLLVVAVLLSLTSCRTHTAFRKASQEDAFRKQYVGKPFYTGIVIRPYEYGEEYLIDLTGELLEVAYETAHAPVIVPLGTPLTITAIDGEHIVARIEGYPRPFRILPRTTAGTLAEVEEQLALVLSKTPPLQTARAAMQPFIVRQEVTRGMSRREVYMSWGQPDKVNSSPGSSGFVEEWLYFDQRMHLFLHDGFVTNWQNF